MRARHILVSCSAQANPADTVKAWKRANAMRTRILSGEDFEAVALSKAGSDDPSVRDNGGDLGWFAANYMQPEFEEAVLGLEVGELSDVIQTASGAHLILRTG